MSVMAAVEEGIKPYLSDIKFCHEYHIPALCLWLITEGI